MGRAGARSVGLGPSGTERERGGEREPNCFVCGPIPPGGSNSVKTIKAFVFIQETAGGKYLLTSLKGSVRMNLICSLIELVLGLLVVLR